MANVPVNIDFHIATTAAPFPNILGPVMINDYIQGLKLGRKNDHTHLQEFVLDDNDQLDRLNQQRILSTISAGKAYEDWCNNWWLSGTRVRQLLAQVFDQINKQKLLAIANNVDITSVWTIQLERRILRELIKVCCKTQLGTNRENEAIEFYGKAAFPESLTQTFNEVIFPHMDYCQDENQFAQNHGNYLKSIFGEDGFSTNIISACIDNTWRLIREKHSGQRIDMSQNVWVTYSRPLIDLNGCPRSIVPPTLDAFPGIATLAPTVEIDQIQNQLWKERRPVLERLRQDLYLVYLLSGALVRNSPEFTVDFLHDRAQGSAPFHPTRLLKPVYSHAAFWQNHQSGDRTIPVAFITGVRQLSESASRVRPEQRHRSEITLTARSPSPQVEKKTPGEGPAGEEAVAYPMIAQMMTLEWALLIGVLGVAVVLSTY